MEPSAEAFGHEPIHLLDANAAYEVDGEDADRAEACGIPSDFPKERLPVMAARAAAYGYVLVLPQEADHASIQAQS